MPRPTTTTQWHPAELSEKYLTFASTSHTVVPSGALVSVSGGTPPTVGTVELGRNYTTQLYATSALTVARCSVVIATILDRVTILVPEPGDDVSTPVLLPIYPSKGQVGPLAATVVKFYDRFVITFP
uniref:Uncharacterized protein n=1 Tax=Anopheles merus TaxID=30066 RepID=A0A182VAP6_ANOME